MLERAARRISTPNFPSGDLSRTVPAHVACYTCLAVRRKGKDSWGVGGESLPFVAQAAVGVDLVAYCSIGMLPVTPMCQKDGLESYPAAIQSPLEYCLRQGYGCRWGGS
jgi:hypothetical protein